MEERLKKERNKLYLRISAIMLAVWLIVSLVFCAVFLNVQKDKLQSDEGLNLSVFTQFMDLITKDDSYIDIDRIFIESFDLLYDEKKKENNFNTQIIISYRSNNDIIADTAKSIGTRFVMKGEGENNFEAYGLINYDTIRGALSDKQYKSIEKKLNETRSDGNYYELICSRCSFKGINIIPLTLKMVLVDKNDNRFLLDDNIETYELKSNRIKEAAVFESSAIARNTIPKDFLLRKVYNNDFISSLSKKQQKESALTIPTGFFENIVYVSNYQNMDSEVYDDTDNRWMFKYAKKINLIDTYKDELAVDVALIFGFFLTIALILCIMIWRTVKTQIVEEHKRIEFTNALAHDIKTPLFVISGYAYSLREDIDSTERDKYLDKILEQTEDINSLVHKMLDLSKLDSYSIKLYRSEFNLYELTENIVKKYEKNIELRHSGDNTVNADRELLKQAIENLIDNAVKYSEKDSIIEVNVEGKDFSISNSCDNLSKADLKNLTRPYFRKDKSRNQKGNGLGLSIVKSIAELHSAELSIRLKNNIISFRISF